MNIMSDGATMSPIMNRGMSSVTMINDFLRTRSPNSRAMMSFMFFMAIDF